MDIVPISKHGQKKKTEVVVLPFWQGKASPAPASDEKACEKLAAHAIKSGDFKGKEGETLLVYPAQGAEKRILLLGLGKKRKEGDEGIRRSYAAAVSQLRSKRIASAHFCLPESADEGMIQAAAEGVLLANYTFDLFKGKAQREEGAAPLKTISFSELDSKGGQLLKKTAVIIESVNGARDLVNGNADEVTSETLSALAKGLEKQYSSLKTTVLGQKELEKEKLGFILAVNKGAVREPALIIIEYKGNPQHKEKIALVGKGITYDTGGLNLKPTGSMETMKCDMSGAAAVLNTIQAAAELKIKQNLIAVLAVAENAIGPKSYKPGDVIVGHAGKTVEVNNTDAEGRLVLSDAFSYIQEKYKPTQIIDLATLTGGIVVALGEEITGFFSNNDTLAKRLIDAGERTGEMVWRMPLLPEYRKMLKSGIADMKNSAGRGASACTAAAFLQEFIGETAWAHLDIAGTAYLTDPKGYNTTHATGVGVRLLIDFLEGS